MEFMRDLYSRTAWGLHPQLTSDDTAGGRIAWLWQQRSAIRLTSLNCKRCTGQVPQVAADTPPPTVPGGSIQSHHRESRQAVREHQLYREAEFKPFGWRAGGLPRPPRMRLVKKLSHLKAALTLHFAYYNFLPSSSVVKEKHLAWQPELQIMCGAWTNCFPRKSLHGKHLSGNWPIVPLPNSLPCR
jgi:hypothetical protein